MAELVSDTGAHLLSAAVNIFKKVRNPIIFHLWSPIKLHKFEKIIGPHESDLIVGRVCGMAYCMYVCFVQ